MNDMEEVRKDIRSLESEILNLINGFSEKHGNCDFDINVDSSPIKTNKGYVNIHIVDVKIKI